MGENKKPKYEGPPTKWENAGSTIKLNQQQNRYQGEGIYQLNGIRHSAGYLLSKGLISNTVYDQINGGVGEAFEELRERCSKTKD